MLCKDNFIVFPPLGKYIFILLVADLQNNTSKNIYAELCEQNNQNILNRYIAII